MNIRLSSWSIVALATTVMVGSVIVIFSILDGDGSVGDRSKDSGIASRSPFKTGELDGTANDRDIRRSVANPFVTKFHGEYSVPTTYPGELEELREQIANSSDRVDLAKRLIGEGNNEINYIRSIKVAKAMMDWPEDLGEAVNFVLDGKNYEEIVGIYTTWQIKAKGMDQIAKWQSSLKMGAERTEVGEELVQAEMVYGTIHSAIQRVREMSVPVDQGEALNEIASALRENEEWATPENVKVILELAQDAGALNKIRRTLGPLLIKESEGSE